MRRAATEIFAVSVRAISALTRTPQNHRVLVAVGADNDPTPRLRLRSARPGRLREWDRPHSLGDLLELHGAELLEHHFVLTGSDQSGALLRARLGTGVPVLHGCAVPVRHRRRSGGGVG